MKRQVLLVLSWLCVWQAVVAQDSIQAFSRTSHALFKLAPLSLLVDSDATVQAGLEYRIGPKTSVQAELGYGWKGLSMHVSATDLDEYVKAEIWRFRPEVRFYTNRYRINHRQTIAVRTSFPWGNYWAMDGLFKQINVTDHEFEEPRASGADRRYVGLMTISRYVLGTHLKIGRQFTAHDPHEGRFTRAIFDMYVGAGVRWATNDVRWNTRTPVYPLCGCGLGSGRSLTDKGGQWAPSITAGLKIGFAL